MKLLSRLAAAALIPLFATQALALDCAPGSTGLTARPRPAETEQGRFKIFWHVATQIEELADAAGNAAYQRDIQAIQPLVDGYYVNVVPPGLLAYWPGRPVQCSVNFGNAFNAGKTLPPVVDGKAILAGPGSDNTEQQCKLERAKDGGNATDVGVKHAEKIKEALHNLQLSNEQKRGKLVMGEMLLATPDLAVDQSSGKISVQTLPRTLCVFAQSGFAPDIMMMYQEPVPQLRQGNMLNLPVGPGRFGNGPRVGMVNNSPYSFAAVANAFKSAGAPVTNFAPNLRVWNQNLEQSKYSRFAKDPSLAAFVFEGGTAPVKGQSTPRILGYAQGAAWILQNTDDEVVFLMPTFYLPQEAAAPNGVDGLIPRLEKTIRDLNGRIGSAMGLPPGKNAICTSRIALIPASYGSPLHPQTFPAQRTGGAFAGTVTGQIEMLAKLRTELCGKG
ncbi:hypothetical protein [Aestuariivirga sp.]|uniref:hypothetical protein n=1 Tax=Aestuariivirga sp. TaxID=2650926 RepID=UPI0039E35167